MFRPPLQVAGSSTWSLVMRARVFAIPLLFASLAGRAETPAKTEPAFDQLPKRARNLSQLLTKANAGDPKAQFEAGIIYALGVGVEQDYAEAVRWYQKAADHGIPAA